MSSSTPLTGDQKVLLGLLALLQFTVLLDFMVLAPLGDVLMKSLRIGPAPFWLATLLNVLLFSGIVSRVVPAMALNTSLPAPADRGAYLSVTSSVQQLAGGLAAVAAGQFVTQPTPTSPLLHFSVLGYATAVAFVGCIPLVYRINQTVRRKPTGEPLTVGAAGFAATLAE